MTAQLEKTGGHLWTAIVLAGERPGGDQLALSNDVTSKALIRVEGKTLLDHVLGALLESPSIGQIVVLAQSPDALSMAAGSATSDSARITYKRCANGIATSILAELKTNASFKPTLVTTADNPLLTPERIEEFLHNSQHADISIGVGEREIVEKRFPQTRRTWLKFRGGHYSGANLFALTSARCLSVLERWSNIEQDRKKGLSLIASFGPWLLLGAVTRTLSFREALANAGKKFGCDVRHVVLDAEAPIDVDKSDDLELVTKILASRRIAGRVAQEERSDHR